MSQENNDSKWKGKSTTQLKTITAEQIWPLFEDFCIFHKWVPDLDSEKCRYVEGAYDEPGLIRLSVFTRQSSSTLANDANAPTKWCKERLLSMDPIQHTLSYEITENNLGFRSYVGNMKVMDIDGGCKIEWSFVADPVEGMRLEDLRGFLESNMKALAEGMSKELQARAN